ncbi:MAG: hypothetical protein ACREIA_05260, partial [Opitutaceae bacterium]
MALTCPACKKANQTESACPRCGCDLTRLHAVAGAADARLRATVASLAARDWPGALAHAERSWRLVHSRESAAAAFLAAASAEDTAGMSRWRARAESLER